MEAKMLEPSDAELTTQRAADILNVSHAFVIQLIDTKQLPHCMVGTQCRIRFADLVHFKRRIDADRRETLGELTEQAQELHMGY
jgi:excisionase family DNA binding protein